MKSVLRTDFLALLENHFADHRPDGTTWVKTGAGEWEQVEVIGYDLDGQLYGNHAENAQVKLERVRELIKDGMTASEAVERIHPDRWRSGSIAMTPDGSGGLFKVQLRHRTKNAGWSTKIDAPSVPGWHDKNWFAFDYQLSPA